MFEIKEPEKVKAKIYGQEIELTKPTVEMIENMELETDKMTNKEKLAWAKQWAVSMGLPIDLANKLQIDHFNMLLEHLTGTKKN